MTSNIFWQQKDSKTCCNSNTTAQLDASSEISATSGGCCSMSSSKEDIIRERAYFLWEEAGRPEGDGIDFWIEAEKQFV